MADEEALRGVAHAFLFTDVRPECGLLITMANDGERDAFMRLYMCAAHSDLHSKYRINTSWFHRVSGGSPTLAAIYKEARVEAATVVPYCRLPEHLHALDDLPPLPPPPAGVLDCSLPPVWRH